MRIFLIAFLLITALRPAPAQGGRDADFEKFAGAYLYGYLAWRPQTAAALGLHEYAGRVTDFRRASVEMEMERLQAAWKTLKTFDPDLLNPVNAADYRTLASSVRGEIFWLAEARYPARNPMIYAEALDPGVYLLRQDLPVADRLRALIALQRQFPQVLAAARENLDKRLPKIFVETAIAMFGALQGYLETELPARVAETRQPVLIAEFTRTNTAAIAACGGFVTWLQDEKLPGARSDFALGAERFAAYLREVELINLSPYQLLAMGKRELKLEQERFAAAAKIIDPNLAPADVFLEMQKEHPSPQDLVTEIRRILGQTRQFVLDRRLVTIPGDAHLPVVETSRADRAVGGAGLNMAGPFEGNGGAWYGVNPVEPAWTPERTSQYLQSMNPYTASIVAIREGFPGDYVRMLHLRRSRVGRLQKILASQSMTGGWAHYCEQMMVAEGFGAVGDEKGAARQRLAQSDEALLYLCRLCVAVGMHCQGMTLAEAARFIEENCYYGSEQAAAEARRGAYDPGYLAQAVGKMEILKLRKDYQAQEGEAFSLEKFHNEVLSHGAPPVRALRGLMLRDPVLASQTLPLQ